MADTDRIFLLGHSQYRFLLLEMARRLRARFGSEIHLYCATAQTAEFWNRSNADGVFASVTVSDTRYTAANRPVTDADAATSRARDQEAWLGTTFNELAMTDRHLGRGYALAGFNHPRSRQSENTSYVQMINAFSATIDFWKREIDAKRPTLLINCGKIPALIARKLALPYRTLAGSRYKNFHQWAVNEFFENPRVEQAFHAIQEAAEADIAQPYYSHMTLRKRFVQHMSLPRLLLRTGHLLLQRLYWRWRGYAKAKGYYTWSEVRYLWMRRQQMKEMARLSVPLSALAGKPFVYYPLHTEPETALQTLSPEYFYQLSCVAALSRDLPAGVKLAVKETFEAVGRRPADFYRQIRELKNVVMIDMMELGLETARQARAVATITGTGGFEAAVMGKPVITFGRHNQYNFLPHVRVITDEITLKRDLQAALDTARDEQRARRDGARFLEAVLKVSFDLRTYDYIHLEKFEPVVVDDMVEALHASLGPARDLPLAAAAPSMDRIPVDQPLA